MARRVRQKREKNEKSGGTLNTRHVRARSLAQIAELWRGRVAPPEHTP
jgi:hypothetical protein